MPRPSLLRSARALPLALLALLAAACAHAPRNAGERTWRERDLVLAPANAYGDVVVFADELEPLEDAVAELLARPEHGGYLVRPNAELRALWADVRVGKLPGVAFRCDAAPPPAMLSAHLYRGASTAEPVVRCEEGRCTLTVIVAGPRPKDDDHDAELEVARFEAALDPKAAPSAWAAELRAHGWKKVPPPEPEGGFGLGGLLTPGHAPGVYVVVHEVTQVGDWATPISNGSFQPYAAELDICSRTGRTWRDWWGQPFLLAVDASGHVVRCEDEHRDHLPPPAFGCTCELLRTLDFGAGKGERRARFYLDTIRVEPGRSHAAAPFYRGADVFLKKATDGSAILGANVVDRAALTACLDPLSPSLGDVTLPVRFQAGPDGRSLGHQVTWAPALPKDVRACLDHVLRTAQFDCPLQGAATIDATLELSVRPWGPPVRADKE